MGELQSSDEKVEQRLHCEEAQAMDIEKIDLDEPGFRWMMNEDTMASEKLAEGIRNFTLDTLKLQQFIAQRLQNQAA